MEDDYSVYMAILGLEFCRGQGNCRDIADEELHPCPFAAEIYDNNELQCLCCADCSHECAMRAQWMFDHGT